MPTTTSRIRFDPYSSFVTDEEKNEAIGRMTTALELRRVGLHAAAREALDHGEAAALTRAALERNQLAPKTPAER